MKKVLVAFGVLMTIGFSANADYSVPGDAWIKGAPGGISWTCDGQGNCYSHTGASTTPTQGDHVVVHDRTLGDTEAILTSAQQEQGPTGPHMVYYGVPE